MMQHLSIRPVEETNCRKFDQNLTEYQNTADFAVNAYYLLIP